MVKATKESKLVQKSNTLSVILTDEHLRLFMEGGQLVISNDAGGLSMELLFRSSIYSAKSKSASGKSGSAAKPARAAAAPSPPRLKPPPATVVQPVTAGVVSHPDPPVTEDDRKPAAVPSKSAKTRESSPARKKKEPKKAPPKLDPLVKVENRLRRMGVWVDGVPAQDQLEKLDVELQLNIVLPSYLWKNYAIENQVTGYEAAAANRERAVSDDPSHTPSNYAKIQAHVASSDAGPCLRQASGKVLTNLEATSKTQVPSSELPAVPQTSGEEEGQVEEPLARENSPVSYASVARQPPSQEARDAATPQEPSEEAGRYPYGHHPGFPNEGSGGRGGRAPGRKSRGRH